MGKLLINIYRKTIKDNLPPLESVMLNNKIEVILTALFL